MRLVPPSPTPQRIPLRGHLMTWATPDAREGPAHPSSIVHGQLHFGYNNLKAVEALVRRVTDPKNVRYGRYLTVEQFAAQFAPSKAHLAQVTTFLQSQGLHVAYVATNHKYVAFEGTVERVSAVFRVSFGVYLVRGLSLQAPETEPSLPDNLIGPHEVTLIGLDHGFMADQILRKRYSAPLNTGPTVPHFLNCVWTSKTKNVADPGLGTCGYKPKQVRGVYHFGGGGDVI